MLKIFPGKISRRLATPHKIVYGEKPDALTWFHLFYVRYFNYQKVVIELPPKYCRNNNKNSKITMQWPYITRFQGSSILTEITRSTWENTPTPTLDWPMIMVYFGGPKVHTWTQTQNHNPLTHKFDNALQTWIQSRNGIPNSSSLHKICHPQGRSYIIYPTTEGVPSKTNPPNSSLTFHPTLFTHATTNLRQIWHFIALR